MIVVGDFLSRARSPSLGVPVKIMRLKYTRNHNRQWCFYILTREYSEVRPCVIYDQKATLDKALVA